VKHRHAVEFPVGDAPAGVVPAAAHAVTPDGKPPNRNAVVENGADARTTRSSPAGRTNIFGNLREFRLRAGPRMGHRQSRSSRCVGMTSAVPDTDSPAPDDVLCLAESFDTAATPATAATDTPLADTRDCSSGLGETLAETSSRTPSTGIAEPRKGGDLRLRSLDQCLHRPQTEGGPRELRLLLRIKPRKEGANFFSRRFLRSLSTRRGDLHRAFLLITQSIPTNGLPSNEPAHSEPARRDQP
jgi:hypothetical protein